MTPKEFADRMRAITSEVVDIGGMHSDADDLLCEVLRSLGYEEGVAIFEGADKWYS